jgi:hypothetical protein
MHLVGYLYEECWSTPTFSTPDILHTYPSTKMEQTECSETSAYKIQTSGSYPEESIQHSEHGESLKSRIFCLAPLVRCLSPARRQITTTLSQLSNSVFILLCCPTYNYLQTDISLCRWHHLYLYKIMPHPSSPSCQSTYGVVVDGAHC